MKEKLILVTGASAGIGRKTAVILSQQGANLILVGRKNEQLLETLKLLERPENHFVEIFDLNDTDDIPNWIKELTKRIGKPLNGFVHSAGLHETIPIRVLKKKHLEKTMTINLYAGIALIKGCSVKGVSARGSSFVLLSSVMGLLGQPGLISYSASKGAIFAAVRCAALELSTYGIRVNSIAPGMVQTEMLSNYLNSVRTEQQEIELNKHPLGFGNAEDIAYAALYLLSDAARWTTGTNMIVDGGYSCH